MHEDWEWWAKACIQLRGVAGFAFMENMGQPPAYSSIAGLLCWAPLRSMRGIFATACALARAGMGSASVVSHTIPVMS